MSAQPQAAVGAPCPGWTAGSKVTGQAPYAADHGTSTVEDVVHAVIVDSSIGRGRITGDRHS